MKKMISWAFKKYTQAELMEFAKIVHLMMTADAQFSTLKAFLDALLVAIKAYETAIGNAAINDSTAVIKEKGHKKDELNEVLARGADKVEELANGDEEVVLASGYKLIEKSKPLTELAPPVGLKAIDIVGKPGVVQFSWKRPKGAKSFVIETLTLDETVWQGGVYTMAVSKTITGLKSGTYTTLRVRAVGTNELLSEWSVEITVLVS